MRRHQLAPPGAASGMHHPAPPLTHAPARLAAPSLPQTQRLLQQQRPRAPAPVWPRRPGRRGRRRQQHGQHAARLAPLPQEDQRFPHQDAGARPTQADRCRRTDAEGRATRANAEGSQQTGHLERRRGELQTMRMRHAQGAPSPAGGGPLPPRRACAAQAQSARTRRSALPARRPLAPPSHSRRPRSPRPPRSRLPPADRQRPPRPGRAPQEGPEGAGSRQLPPHRRQALGAPLARARLDGVSPGPPRAV